MKLKRGIFKGMNTEELLVIVSFLLFCFICVLVNMCIKTSVQMENYKGLYSESNELNNVLSIENEKLANELENAKLYSIELQGIVDNDIELIQELKDKVEELESRPN